MAICQQVRTIVREELERLGLIQPPAAPKRETICGYPVPAAVADVGQEDGQIRPLQCGDMVAKGGILMTIEDAAKDTVTTARFNEQGKLRREEHARGDLRRMIYDPVPCR